MKELSKDIKSILRSKLEAIDDELSFLEDDIAMSSEKIEWLQKRLDMKIDEYNKLNAIAKEICDLIGYEKEEA